MFLRSRRRLHGRPFYDENRLCGDRLTRAIRGGIIFGDGGHSLTVVEQRLSRRSDCVSDIGDSRKQPAYCPFTHSLRWIAKKGSENRIGALRLGSRICLYDPVQDA